MIYDNISKRQNVTKELVTVFKQGVFVCLFSREYILGFEAKQKQ